MVINKTPHAVHIMDDNGDIIRTYESQLPPIRISTTIHKGQPLPDGTPTTITLFGKVEDLPEPTVEVFYIVSQLVKNELPHRQDLFVPAEVMRDKDGNIIGCKSLGR